MASARSLASRFSSNMGDDAISQPDGEHISTQIGIYKGNLVAVKKIKPHQIILSREDLLELKLVCRLYDVVTIKIQEIVRAIITLLIL